jgi:peptidoglycan/LPS O-acetylase OafA/YrhL
MDVPIRDGMALMTVTAGLLDGHGRAASMAKTRFDVLDSWRGICALLVALFHFPAAGWLATNGFIRGSYLFVDFFFVLSGFVIAHAYGERLADGGSLRRFMITRFGRLFPLHAFMLLALMAFELIRWVLPQLAGGEAAFTGAFSVSSIFTNLFMVHGLGVEQGLTWNGPSWSISTELFAYLLFGVTVLLLGRTALLAFSAAIVVAPLFLLAVSPDFMDATWDFGMIRCIYGFSSGVIVHTLYVQAGETPSRDGETVASWTFAEAAVILAVVLFVATSHANALSLFAPLVFGFAVFIFAHEGGLVSRILSARPFLGLGALSYSIYMTHMFVQARMMNVAKVADGHFGASLLEADGAGFASAWAWPMAGLMVAATLVVSAVTYRLVEVPGREWFREMAKRVR